MTSGSNKGNTIRRRARTTGAPRTREGDRPAGRGEAAAARAMAASRTVAAGTRPPLRQQESLRVGGHTIRIERDDDRVHLVLGGVFRLVMTLEEAGDLASALVTLSVATKP